MSKKKEKRERKALQAAVVIVNALEGAGIVKKGTKVEVRICGKKARQKKQTKPWQRRKFKLG
jgi:hypothetical protein